MSEGESFEIAEISKQAKSASETVGQIEHNVGRAQENSGALERSVERIASVVALINKIARQTHLLSLNATIEAARVGDDGRGFSVVTNEVKELANQTSLAKWEAVAPAYIVERVLLALCDELTKLIDDPDIANSMGPPILKLSLALAEYRDTRREQR